MKHTINISTLIFVLFLMITPILMDWNRPLSPRVYLKRNIEFNTEWDYSTHQYTIYTVVLSYCNQIKPDDTIQVQYSHIPTYKDIVCAGWFNETYSFFAPDNKYSKEYMFVCNLRVL